jgi:aryl-alcohol dehydrogenase-like predicted oxidoreductase
MRYRLLGRSGLRVSELCLGTMVFGDVRGPWGATAEDAATIVSRFAADGGNFIDTASNYAGGESERIVGELVRSDRDWWVVATKYTCSSRPDDPNAGGNHRKSLVRSLEGSLQRLRVDYIDLLWVHIWDALTPIEEVVRALDDVVRAGKALYVGISDTPAWLVARAVTLAELRGWSPFVGLQVPYSLIERTVERELLPMARGLDLAVTAWSPLGDGILTGRYGHDRSEPDDSRVARVARHRVSERNLTIADALNGIAEARAVSAAQVAIAWVKAQQQRAEIIPIIGARTPAQLEDNLGSLAIVLEQEELELLDGASAIALGFPYEFGGFRLAYGNTLELIDDHHRSMRVPLQGQ